jgi:hypothetical protein
MYRPMRRLSPSTCIATLRHLSADCRALLAKAGDLVEVNVLEDPVGGCTSSLIHSLRNRSACQVKPFHLSRETVLPIE